MKPGASDLTKKDAKATGVLKHHSHHRHWQGRPVKVDLQTMPGAGQKPRSLLKGPMTLAVKGQQMK